MRDKQLDAVRRELQHALDDGHWDLARRIVAANPDLKVRAVTLCDGSVELEELP